MQRVSRTRLKHLGVAIGAIAGLVFVGQAYAQGLRLEVSHRWTGEGESKAVKVIADAFTAAGGVWLDRGVAPGPRQVQDALGRIIGGDPYGAVNFNLGDPALTEVVNNGLMRNIDDVALDSDWIKALAPAVRNAISYDGHVFAIPVSLQSNVVLYTNLKVLKDHGIAEPQSWDEFFAAADKLKAAGVIPIAFGGQDFQERITFIGLVGWIGGPQLLNDLYIKNSVDAARSPEFRKVVETYKRFHDYVDEGQSGRAWDVSTNLVATGQAAFRIMGDFAKAVLTGAGMEPKVDFSCRFGPEDGVQYIFGNSFAFPKMKGEDNLKAQNLFIKEAMDKQVQLDFAIKKGGLPARTDVDTSSFDACTQQSLQAMATPNKTVAWPLMTQNPDVVGKQKDLVHQFWGDPSMSVDDFVNQFADTVAFAKGLEGK